MTPRLSRTSAAGIAALCALSLVAATSPLLRAAAAPARQETPAAKTAAPEKAEDPKEKAKDAILARTVLKYRGFASLEQTVRGKMTIQVGETRIVTESVSKVRMAQPNRFRLEMTSTFGEKTEQGTSCSDGTTVWESDPKAKRYSEATFATISKDEDGFTDWITDRFSADVTPLFFLKAAGGPFDQVSKEDVESIDVGAYPTETLNGGKVHVIPTADDREMLLYIGVEDRLIKRCVMRSTEKDGTKVEMTLDYLDVKTGREIPAAEFRLDTAGQEKAAQVSTAFDRLFGDE